MQFEQDQSQDGATLVLATIGFSRDRTTIFTVPASLMQASSPT